MTLLDYDATVEVSPPPIGQATEEGRPALLGVAIIGLLEWLGIGRAILAQPESFGAHLEVYAFVAAVFFVLCYAMSQASYRLERALGVGSR